MISLLIANTTINAWYDQIPGLRWVINILEGSLNIDAWIDWVANFAKGLSFTEQVIWLVVLVLILISGIIGLIKVVSKLAIIAAIIFAVWLLFQNNVF